MRFAGMPLDAWKSSLQAVVAAMLCVLMVEQPLLAASPVPKRGPTAGAAPAAPQIQGDIRTLHALNRLTFGPRPGDVAAVQAMGLSKWFELQLNPSSIDDSALDARLQMFPAMQMSQAELTQRYPSPQVIRQLAQRGGPLPVDPVEHAIYADSIALYKIQQAKQAAAKDQSAAAPAMDGSGNAMTASSGDMSSAPNAMSADGSMVPPPPPGKKPRKPVAPPDMGGADMAGPADSMAPAPPPAGAPKPEAADAGPGIATGPAPAQHVESLFQDLEALKILDLAPDQRMQKILAMPPEKMIAFRRSLSGDELGQLSQGLSPIQKETLAALQGSNRMIGSEELQSRLLRDIYSDRQLEAVMTDFWLNHFNVYIRKNQNEPYLIPAYERETIRPNALGRFEDLLVATARSPAMLTYLDNAQSVGPGSKAAVQGPRYAALAQNPQVKAALKDRGLNENYGRELMELHTLGVGGGYTQADVTQVAKVFTGWTIAQPYRGGDYSFDDRRHEPGPKTVLGQTIPEGGEREGLQVLHILATSPATAKFISTKLAVRFVSDTPPASLVDKMTRSFLASDGDIKTVLRTMFNAPEFWAPTVVKAKVKTPEEFVISAVRASGATINNAQSLVQSLDKLGMPLYGMQTPNGYSWTSDGWVSTGALVSRMNFALVLTGDKLPGVRTDWSKLLGPALAAKPVSFDTTGASAIDPDAAAKEKKLEQILLGQSVSSRTRATVLGQSLDSTAAIQAAKEFQVGPNPAAGLGNIGGAFDPALPSPRANRPGTGPAQQRNRRPPGRHHGGSAPRLPGVPAPLAARPTHHWLVWIPTPFRSSRKISSFSCCHSRRESASVLVLP